MPGAGTRLSGTPGLEAARLRDLYIPLEPRHAAAAGESIVSEVVAVATKGLADAAIQATEEAQRRGHSLTTWVFCRNHRGGKKWTAYCRTCGAMALAEHDNAGTASASGNTQRRPCAGIVASKAKRTARRKTSA